MVKQKNLHIRTWKSVESIETKTDIFYHHRRIDKLCSLLNFPLSNCRRITLDLIQVNFFVTNVKFFSQRSCHDLKKLFELFFVSSNKGDWYFSDCGCLHFLLLSRLCFWLLLDLFRLFLCLFSFDLRLILMFFFLHTKFHF